MRLLAIDPDPNGGSWVEIGTLGHLIAFGYQMPSDQLCQMVRMEGTQVVIEDVQSYGMPVGRTVFDTVKIIGEVRATCRRAMISYDESLTRPKIKTALCSTPRAKDANVRAALIDLYGGSREAAIGTKKKPGPLHGVSKDVWAALALAVVWLQTQKLGPLYERDRVS